MSRNNLITLLLIIASLLLAVALFIAGAIWRGRTTTRSAAMDSRESVVLARWLQQIAGPGESTRLPGGGSAYQKRRPNFFDDGDWMTECPWGKSAR